LGCFVKSSMQPGDLLHQLALIHHMFCAPTQNSFLPAIKGWCMVRIRQRVCDRALSSVSLYKVLSPNSLYRALSPHRLYRALSPNSCIQGVVAQESGQSQTSYRRRDQSGMLRLNIYIYLFKQLMYNFMQLIFALLYNHTYVRDCN